MLKVNIEQVINFFQEYMDAERANREAYKSYKTTCEKQEYTYRIFREAEQRVKAICDVLNLDFCKCMLLARAYQKWGNRTEWQIWLDTQNEKNYNRFLNYLIRDDNRTYSSYFCHYNNKNMKSNEYLLFMQGVISEWAIRSKQKKNAA